MAETNENDHVFDKYDKDDVYFIKFFFIYVNGENEIEKVTEDVFELNDVNTLSSAELCAIVERNKVHNNMKYNLMDLLKFNVTMDTTEVMNGNYNMPALISVQNIVNDIHFMPSIIFFQSLNCLYVILKEKPTVPASNSTKTRKRRLCIKNRSRTLKNASSGVTT